MFIQMHFSYSVERSDFVSTPLCASLFYEKTLTASSKQNNNFQHYSSQRAVIFRETLTDFD